jgi:hypothetical protein
LYKRVANILQKCYDEVVNPSILRKAKGSFTYGESTIVLVRSILKEYHADLHCKTFVDLGSGCGQVCFTRFHFLNVSSIFVLQVCMMVAALSSAAKCFGIEMLSAPHEFALKLLHRFQCDLRALNIACAPIELLQGDFLQINSSLRDALSSAGIVYLNNPKFEPFVNFAILEHLCPILPKKTKVICFESIIGTKGYWNNCLMCVA